MQKGRFPSVAGSSLCYCTHPSPALAVPLLCLFDSTRPSGLLKHEGCQPWSVLGSRAHSGAVGSRRTSTRGYDPGQPIRRGAVLLASAKMHELSAALRRTAGRPISRNTLHLRALFGCMRCVERACQIGAENGHWGVRAAPGCTARAETWCKRMAYNADLSRRIAIVAKSWPKTNPNCPRAEA